MAVIRLATPVRSLVVLVLLSCTFASASSTQNGTVSRASYLNTTAATGLSTSESSSDVISASSISTDSDVSSTSTLVLGDFIASGLGLSAESDTSSGNVGEEPTDKPSVTGTGSSYTSQEPSTSLLRDKGDESITPTTRASQGLALVSTNLTLGTNIGTAVSPKPTNATATETGYIPENPNAIPPDPPILYNQSFTLSGDCWNRWSQFWSASSLVAEYEFYKHEYTTTFTTTESSMWMVTSTFLSFYTTTVRGGQFPLTTYSTLAPVTDFDWFGTPTTTWTTTQTTYDLTQMDVRPNASLPVPSCVLPTLVSQCQNSWDRYITHKTAREDLPFDSDGPPGCNAFATTTIPISCKEPISTWASVRSSYFANEPQLPDCSQAKVPDDYCSSTRSQYIFKAEGKSSQLDGVPIIDWTETTIDGTETRVPTWPPNKTIGGPGCTLGCGSCAMQGGTVELIYWPPATTTGNVSIHGPVTAEALGTTFTSPTVYVSFDYLWARNSCSRFGTTISNTIVAITNTEAMSSLWGYGWPNGQQYTDSFNFTDLYVTPVPDSIYEMQPRCAASKARAKGGRYRPVPSDYAGCARTAPYEPIIVIPLEVRSLDPAWAMCNGGIRGVYDPPLALTPRSAIVVPTKPAGSDPTTAAAPAPTPTSDAAPETRPATFPSKLPPTAEPVQNTESKDPPKPVDDPATKTSQGAAGNANNQWPLPPVTTEAPTTTNALSVLLSAMSSKAQADAAAHSADSPGASNNGQQQAGTKPFDSSGGQSGSKDPAGSVQEGGSNNDGHAQSDDPSGSKASSESGQEGGSQNGGSQQSEHGSPNAGTHPEDIDQSDNPSDPIAPGTPANAGEGTVTWQHDGQAFTAIPSNEAVIVQGNGAKSTLAAGAIGVLEGQVIEIPSAGDAVVINGAAASFTSPARSGNDQGNKDSPTATFTESGQIFTAAVQGSSVVLRAAGSTTTMAYGAQGTLAGQSVSMPASPGTSVIEINGKPFTLPAGSGNNQGNNDPPIATFTESGQIFTAAVQGSSVVLKAAGSTTTMAYGAQGTFAGQLVSIPSPSSPEPNVVKVNDKSFTLHGGGGDNADDNESSPQTQLAAIITQDGKTYTAIQQGASTLILEAASTTLTIPPGAAVTLDGEVFSVPATGRILVHDGTTNTLSPTALPTKPSYTAAAGQTLSAFDLGSSIIVVAGGSTITLPDGAQTTLGSTTLSAASTGGAVIVIDENGKTSTTLIASSSSRTTNAAAFSSSASGDSGGADATPSSVEEAGPDSEGAAVSGNNRSLGWKSILLVVTSCVFAAGL